MKSSMSFALLFFFAGLVPVWGQTQEFPFTEDHWNLSEADYQLEKFKGKKGIALKGRLDLKQLVMKDGTIEVDLNFPAKRNFPGVYFRTRQKSYEEFYVRPHQSGNPDACQYSPVFYGTAAWQLYHGEGFGTKLELTADTWHHLKIVVKSNSAEVYWDEDPSPILVAKLLTGAKEGRIAISGGAEYVHFANFQFTPAAPQTQFAEPIPDLLALKRSEVRFWQVSRVVNDSLVWGKTELDPNWLRGFRWRSQSPQYKNILNLAEFGARTEFANTIMCRLEVQATKAGPYLLELGYSDDIQVYCNGQILYRGTNQFRSRDYRYLGTIGYFDGVYLPLKAGKNDIVITVRERFGGWGLMGKWANSEGIRY